MSDAILRKSLALMPALALAACTVQESAPQATSQALESVGDDKALTFEQFIRASSTRFVMTPEYNEDVTKVKLVKELRLEDATVRMSFRLDPKQEGLLDLFPAWRDAREVTASWGPVFAKVEGLEAREVPVRLDDLQGVLTDPTVRSICGHYKAVGPAQLTIDGQEYDATVKVSLADVHYATQGAPAESEAANIACEEETWFLVVDYCGDDCSFILPADPKIEATCTLGGLVGMVTTSGTPIGGAGGAEIGVLATVTASCWNEFKGKCKLVGAFWGDYCTCSSSNAPKLVCNAVGSPCQGSPGGSCRNPTWSCGSGGASEADAGTAQTGGH